MRLARRGFALIVAAALAIGLWPAAGAASNDIRLELVIGSPTMTVNGVESAIQQPYIESGTTMVPLSVITRAFGAGLKLENNKTITLTYNSTTVVLTIGSATVKVNDVEHTLAVAPKIVNDLTMVPLRFIVQAFGATVTPNGGAITIVGKKAGVEAASESSDTINPDAGKTKVGDSYFGWSMNYPSGLTLVDQSDNGDVALWHDVNEKPGLIVFVDEVSGELSREEMARHVEGYYAEDEFTLERRSISVNGRTFEKIVSRSRNGWYFEYRAVQQEDRVYIVTSGIESDDRSALDAYKGLLDSFDLSFDAADPELKDITKVRDGVITLQDEDYGLTVQLPPDWIHLTDSTYPLFIKGEDHFLSFEVRTLKPGETALQWMKEERASWEEEYAPGYLRNIRQSTKLMKDGRANVLSMDYSFDKKTWWTSHDVYLITGGHKYYISYSYLIGAAEDSEEVYRRAISSLDIDVRFIDAHFSDIEEDESLDTLTTVKTSKKYKYSITLPQSWTGIETDFESDAISYNYDYGFFFVFVYEDIPASALSQEIQREIRESGELSGQKLKNLTYPTIGGRSAIKLEVENSGSGSPSNSVSYILEHNNCSYLFVFSTFQSNDTSKRRTQIEGVIQSLQFTP